MDKYAHLRPQRSRSCVTSTGRLKRPLDEAQARDAAANLTARNGSRVNAYRCPDCGWWHTGRAPRATA